MFYDRTDLEEALSHLPMEAWGGWKVSRIVDWLFDYLENKERTIEADWENEGGQ